MKLRFVAAALLAGVLVLTAACSKDGAEAANKGAGGRPGGRGTAFPVEVLTVTPRQVEYAVTAVGSVEAFERVEVTARVAGAIERVLFTEGQIANKGDTLVEIEPERYRLAVASAQANVESEQAALAEARAGLARRETASEKNPGLIRGEEIETWRTRTRTAEAEVSQARAALEQAKLNLRDALVRAPVSGTIQTRTVQTGQYVQPGTVLATLVRRDPLLLRFQVPEQESASVRPGMVARFRVAGDQGEHTAHIRHVAESASTTSRMVIVTANIDAPNRAALKPGAFAQVTVPIGSNTTAPVIPQTAIRPSERGFLAYVIEGNKASERVLTLGMRTADGQVEVREGIRPGEQLVIRGAEALRDGADVRVEGQKEQMSVKPVASP
jgi:multidrug efflux system membrane fusion protein